MFVESCTAILFACGQLKYTHGETRLVGHGYMEVLVEGADNTGIDILYIEMLLSTWV